MKNTKDTETILIVIMDSKLLRINLLYTNQPQIFIINQTNNRFLITRNLKREFKRILTVFTVLLILITTNPSIFKIIIIIKMRFKTFIVWKCLPRKLDKQGLNCNLKVKIDKNYIRVKVTEKWIKLNTYHNILIWCNLTYRNLKSN